MERWINIRNHSIVLHSRTGNFGIRPLEPFDLKNVGDELFACTLPKIFPLGFRKSRTWVRLDNLVWNKMKHHFQQVKQ